MTSGRILMWMPWLEKMLVGAAGFCVLMASVLPGQLPTSPSFEVASIKLNDSDKDHPGYSSWHFSSTPSQGTLVATNELIRNFILSAYAPPGEEQLEGNQLIGGPAWISVKKYDISAKVDDSVREAWLKLPESQQAEMMKMAERNLLAGRFKLIVTAEKKEETVYSLVVANGGPKLARAKPFAPAPPADCNRTNAQTLCPPTAVTMDRFTEWLRRQAVFSNGIVLNQTGLNGEYEVSLHFRFGHNTSEPDIFSALQEQLGLRIETKKAPMETIVIDHIEEPTPN